MDLRKKDLIESFCKGQNFKKGKIRVFCYFLVIVLKIVRSLFWYTCMQAPLLAGPRVAVMASFDCIYS